MESIRDVLAKITIPPSTGAASTVTSSSLNCAICGGAGWLRYDVDVADPRFGQVAPCGCKAKEIEEKRMRFLVERSNLETLRSLTFSAFMPHDYQKNAFARARDFAENPEGWLVMLGPYGTGKTHLAAAIGNRRLELGAPAIFVVAPDLLDHLRSTFNPASETPFDELFESVRTAPLLLLDDLGTQSTTPWAAEKMFQILNSRYMAKLPTVITTNARLEDLGDRLASRMAAADLSTLVQIVGSDIRTGRESAPTTATNPPRQRSPRPRQF